MGTLYKNNTWYLVKGETLNVIRICLDKLITTVVEDGISAPEIVIMLGETKAHLPKNPPEAF